MQDSMQETAIKDKKISAFSMERQDGVAVITFDMPGSKVNTLNSSLFEDFEALLTEVEASSELESVVLLSGKKGCFIAGADIEELANAKDEAAVRQLSERGQALFNRWSYEGAGCGCYSGSVPGWRSRVGHGLRL